MLRKSVLIFLAVVVITLPLSAEEKSPEDLMLTKEIVVKATPSEVWNAWTTSEGFATFFASESKIELKKLGDYKIYIIPNAPRGERGADYTRVLSYVPEKMFSFEWSVPPSFPELRKKYPNKQFVVLFFDSVDDKHTKVTMHHLGFGKEKEWFEVYKYFDKAWDFVLKRLQKRFKDGPLQWESRK